MNNYKKMINNLINAIYTIYSIGCYLYNKKWLFTYNYIPKMLKHKRYNNYIPYINSRFKCKCECCIHFEDTSFSLSFNNYKIINEPIDKKEKKYNIVIKDIHKNNNNNKHNDTRLFKFIIKNLDFRNNNKN
jgi:hypothetical protein